MSFTDATQFWNERFDKDEFIFGKEPNEYLVEQASQYLKPTSSVLCIADGFDVSDIALAKANQFCRENLVNIQYSLCDTDGFDWQKNAYDAVVGIFIQFADPEMRARIFKQVHQSLKPGGIFILQGYTPKQLEYKTGGPSLLEHLYTEEMIRDLSQGFEILDLQCYEKMLTEGARHTGMSALLGMVAKKIA
jgi:SAM-dependent methyltransferase